MCSSSMEMRYTSLEVARSTTAVVGAPAVRTAASILPFFRSSAESPKDMYTAFTSSMVMS